VTLDATDVERHLVTGVLERHGCATPTGVPQFRQVELRNAGLVRREAIRILAFLSSGAWN
jgi:hypothetical protein